MYAPDEGVGGVGVVVFVGAGVGGQQELTNARSPVKTTKNFIFLECLQNDGRLSKNTGGMCSDPRDAINRLILVQLLNSQLAKSEA